jgi:hypothetical protein
MREEMVMFVRMKAMKKVSSKRYRVTLDVLDPERDHWDYGDCQFQVDLSPKDPPEAPTDAEERSE